MAISKENKRVIITVPKDVHEKISKIATVENRSVSNYIVTLLLKHIENQQK